MLKRRRQIQAAIRHGWQSVGVGSLPVPKFDVAEFLFDDAVYAGRLSAQAAKLAERFEPRLDCGCANAQLFWELLAGRERRESRGAVFMFCNRLIFMGWIGDLSICRRRVH